MRTRRLAHSASLRTIRGSPRSAASAASSSSSFVLERDGERVDLVGRRTSARAPAATGGERAGRRGGLGLGDRERAGERALGARAASARASRRSPSRRRRARGRRCPADAVASTCATRPLRTSSVLVVGRDVARLGVGAAPRRRPEVGQQVEHRPGGRVERAELGLGRRRRRVGQVRPLRGLGAHSAIGGLGDAERAQLVGAAAAAQPARQRSSSTPRPPPGARARGRAAAQRRGRVRQHRGVRGAVPGGGEAHERLRQDVVQAVAAAVDRVARQQRAERELVAVGIVGVASPMRRAASRPASAGTGEARVVAGPSAAWPSAFAALAASAAAGCEALSAGSLTTIAGRTPGSDRVGARRAAVDGGHLGGAERRRDRGDRGRPAARRERLRRVDDAPAAERDERSPSISPSSSPASSSTRPGGTRETTPRALRELGAVERPASRQQRVAAAERVERAGERATTEVDRALAVAPDEGREGKPRSDADTKVEVLLTPA